ncbi:MAG: zinc ribbon domain-containing protein [Methanomicrobiales archaeon]|nr:zinc ribbon domain-containing protein [Methanomicrobiales archaeon]
MKFCSACGASVAPGETAPESPGEGAVCPKCGTTIDPESAVCPECNTVVNPELVDKKPVSDTSRWYGLAIQKYLQPNEIAIFRTKGNLVVGGEDGLKGYVTNNRVMFYASKGLVFKKDRLLEMQLSSLSTFRIVEEGMILKKMHLRLNDFKITGNRSDILELYSTIQRLKQAAK